MLDRPYPVDYEYKGIKMKIDLRYPAGGDVPTSATITAIDAPKIAEIVEITVASYEEAVEQGKRAAEAWIDLR